MSDEYILYETDKGTIVVTPQSDSRLLWEIIRDLLARLDEYDDGSVDVNLPNIRDNGRAH